MSRPAVSKPIALECNKCGASLHNKQGKCEYCGTEYRWSNDGPYVGPPVSNAMSWKGSVHGVHSSSSFFSSYCTVMDGDGPRIIREW